MKGLILKDLLFIKGNIKSLMIFIVCILLFIVNSDGNITSVLFLVPFFLVTLCISTFSYDDYNKWNSYAITLPGGRKNIVISKYIMTVIMIVLGLIISILTILSMSFINNKINIINYIIILLGSGFGMAVMISIMYPLIYKFGSEKGRIGLFIIIVALSTLSGFLLKSIDEKFLNKFVLVLNNYGIYLLPIISILFIYISYKISLNIYKNKDF